MALVSANYQVPTNMEPRCIERQATSGESVLMKLCDPVDVRQRFRVTRVNPGQNPGVLVSGSGQSGVLAQILDRDSGLCLTQGTKRITTNFDPNYAKCGTGAVQPVEGWDIVLDKCTSSDPLNYPGYNWLMIPSFAYCGDPDGCPGCSGSPICARVPGTNTCQGTIGCTGAEEMIIAPQLIYIGNLDLSKIPVGAEGYQGLTGLNAIYKWAIDNNATALYYGGSGDNVILGELAGDITQCINSGYFGQYLNISTYNQLSSLKVCLANQPVTDVPCVNL